MITLRLPWPPSINHYYRHVGSKVLISRIGRAYRQEVGMLYMAEHGNATALEGRLNIGITATRGDKRSYDIDNLLKPLLDSLQHAGVFLNDSQIDSLSIVRLVPQPGDSHVMVQIKEIQ